MNNQTDINKIIFVTGDQKNAGKTTFLKHLLFEARKHNKKIIVSSIGVDGEKSDAIYGNRKPDIILEKGDMVITTEDAVNSSSALCEILNVFENDKYNSNERPVLARALRRGEIELISVGSNFMLSDILYASNDLVKPDMVFIDGAADRITQVASMKEASFYYVVKIDNSNFSSALNNILKLDVLSKLSVFSESKDILKINGALTKNKVEDLPKDTIKIVIDDFTKVFLKLSELKIFLKKRQLYVQNKYDLTSVVVINNGVDKQQIVDVLKDSEILQKIVFNPYESHN